MSISKKPLKLNKKKGKKLEDLIDKKTFKI